MFVKLNVDFLPNILCLLLFTWQTKFVEIYPCWETLMHTAVCEIMYQLISILYTFLNESSKWAEMGCLCLGLVLVLEYLIAGLPYISQVRPISHTIFLHIFPPIFFSCVNWKYLFLDNYAYWNLVWKYFKMSL